MNSTVIKWLLTFLFRDRKINDDDLQEQNSPNTTFDRSYVKQEVEEQPLDDSDLSAQNMLSNFRDCLQVKRETAIFGNRIKNGSCSNLRDHSLKVEGNYLEGLLQTDYNVPLTEEVKAKVADLSLANLLVLLSQTPQSSKVIQSLFPLLKSEKDSWRSDEFGIQKILNQRENIYRQNDIVCPLGVDAYGVIKFVGKNSAQVFWARDLAGLNFFDLMANYNKTYFQKKFGTHPILGMVNSNTVLRFSLKHMDEDMEMTVLTCRVSLVYGKLQQGKKRSIRGAKIFVRKSSKSSTQVFRKKVTQSTVEAGVEAIKQLAELNTLKENFAKTMKENWDSPLFKDLEHPGENYAFEKTCHL